MNITEGTAQMVREAIASAQETISSTSAKSGIPYATLYRKAHGAIPGFTVTELGNISDALGIPVLDLIHTEDAA